MMLNQKIISFLLMLSLIQSFYPLNNQLLKTIKPPPLPLKKTIAEPYIKQFYAINDQYGTAGAIAVLKIASATFEQIEWMEVPEEDLHLYKEKLELEVIEIEKFNHKLTTAIQKHTDEYNNLKPWDKILNGKKIKSEIENIQHSQKELIARIEIIAKTMQMINQAISFHQHHSFKIYHPSTNANKRIEHVLIIPLRQEIINLKASTPFQTIIAYQKENITLLQQTIKEYQQIKRILFDQLINLHKKADFYAARAHELNLLEELEFSNIQEEITYIAKKLI